MSSVVECGLCRFRNEFPTSRLHAGFSDQGFLYNEAGDLTLVWSALDPAYERVAKGKQPWTLDSDERAALERVLLPSPRGDRWLFRNPGRCLQCRAPLTPPMGESIYYLFYPSSVNVDVTMGDVGFETVLRQ
jgi:hypothetical protein